MSCNNEETDETIAERFKKDYTEQFYILARMHLSFLLDRNTEESDSLPEKARARKWNLVPFSKKSKLRNVTEGIPLTQDGIDQIFQLIEYLKLEENIKSEGIFRRTGSIERQQELRNLLNQVSTLNLNRGTYSVHDCASVLKGFLQDLPDPLLTEVHFPVYCQIAELYDISLLNSTQEAKLLEALQLLLLLLPSENKSLLKDLLELLNLTASYESFNRMSPENLAKLFTPHLLCPRNLTPAVLLKVSQSLFGIVSFMIQKYSELFKIPAKLILEFRVKYEKKRVLSPVRRLNESTADVASTVFTFVDQERTAKENESNPTETALALLYAHIQSLPESSKKRKLVKQFNKENGQGTPLQSAKNPKNRSIGDSIKKHIFQKHLAKKKGFPFKNPCDHMESPTGSPSLVTRARLFCHHTGDSSTDQSHEGPCPLPSKRRKSSRSYDRLEAQENGQGKTSLSETEYSEREDSTDRLSNVYLTSTPACFPLKACNDVFTPNVKDRRSMSPITMSAQRMSRAMQETMMTPRSRKPVLLLSGTNISTLPKRDYPSSSMDDVIEEKLDTPLSGHQTHLPIKSISEPDIKVNRIEIKKMNKSDSEVALTDTFQEYLSSRDLLVCHSPQDSSFSSRTDDFNSTDLENLTDGQFSDSLMYCLNGNDPEEMNVIEEEQEEEEQEKKLVLKPKQFDRNGKAIIFETSF